MNLRVLVAESEQEEALFLQDVLREIENERWLREWDGIEPLPAATWLEAEHILISAPPDLLLLDSELADHPGAGGYYRSQAVAPEVPVILLVNSCDDALAVRLMREGLQDFLIKQQVDCAPLAHAIRNAVSRHRLGAALRAAVSTDSLTGLPGRGGFLELAGRDRLLAERLGRRWMLLIAEPKNLVEMAAAYGEQRRDLELMKAADRLRSLAGPADLLARIGGRRFAIAIFDTEKETVEEAWMRIRVAAAERRIEVGVSIFDPSRPLSLDAMLEQAAQDLAPASQAAGAA